MTSNTRTGDIERQLRGETFQRSASITTRAVDPDARTVEIAISSEALVDRFFGWERLSHRAEDVDLSRLHDGAPLLLGHDPDRQIGVVEHARLDRDAVRVTVRLSRSQKAQEILDDLADGIRRKASVGYRVLDVAKEKTKGEDGRSVYRCRWLPLEASIVAIPADNAVGVGRSLTHGRREEFEMSEVTTREDERVDRIHAIARVAAERRPYAAELAEQYVAGGKSPEEYQRALVAQGEEMAAASPRTPEISLTTGTGAPAFGPTLGLSPRDVGSYSLNRVLWALANPNDRRAQEAAGFEFEVSAAAQDASRRDGKGERGSLTIPHEVFQRGLLKSNTGQYGIGTDHRGDLFIDLLRNRSLMARLGTVLEGLQGDVEIPKQTAGGTAGWVGEDADVSESNQTLGQVNLRPKTVGHYSDIGRKLLLQSSPDAENLVRNDLMAAVGTAVDLAALNGSGAGQPLGIIQTTGVNTAALTNDAPTWAEIVSMETEISTDNADVARMFYVTTPALRGWMKSTPKFENTGEPIWTDGPEPGVGSIGGYGAYVTNQMPSGYVLFGDFSSLLVGLWGGVDVIVDPLTLARKGALRVTVLQDVDCALRLPESFCVGV